MNVPMLRNSERQAFKTCRHRWAWTYRDGRQSQDAPHALRFGDLIHRALAEYHVPGVKKGSHPAAVFERLYHEEASRLDGLGYDIWSDDKWVEAGDLGPAMLRGYVEEFAERDSEWEVLASEQTFQLIINVPAVRARGNVAGRPGFRFKIVGTFDGVWRHRRTGKIAFKEYKTAAAIKLDGLTLDEQAGLYWTYGPKWLRRRGLLPEGAVIDHIMYTFLRKSAPNPDKARDEFGNVLNKPTKDALVSKCEELGLDAKGTVPILSDRLALAGVDVVQLGEPAANQPAPYFAREPVYRDEEQRRKVHARVMDEARDIFDARRGLLPLYKNPGPLHMPNCLGCAVREACELHESGGDFAAVLEMTMTDWDPYAAHELPERS